MPRSAARRAMTAPSPGRKRMVMRSVARTRSAAASYDAGPRVFPSSSTNARIAINASLDSEMPAAWARVAKRAFSAAEALAVIDSRVARVARQLNSISDVGPSLRPQLCACCPRPRGAGGKGRGRALCRFIRDRVEARAGLTVVVERVISSVIAVAEINRRQPMTTLEIPPQQCATSTTAVGVP